MTQADNTSQPHCPPPVGERRNYAGDAIDNAALYEDAWRAADDLREANAQMVSATIRAQELSEEAEASKVRAEASERELREVAEFREMLIGIVGHDLRNPLGSINMASNLLFRRGNLDPQADRQVARIVKSSQRMTRMISQLLDLTRARLGGGFPVEPRPTDLGEVCRRKGGLPGAGGDRRS